LLTILFLGFIASSSSSSAAPLQQDEPWGYLWELRMLRLHPLTADVVRIGRLGNSHIVLTHPLVSRRHLEIRRSAEGVVVKDLGSTNGTRVNFVELRVGQETPIHPGALLEVAEEKLLFHESKERLLDEALQFMLLARFAVPRVPVLQDRIVRALGREREIHGISQAIVNLEKEEVKMIYANETESRLFSPGDTVFVSDVAIVDGQLRVGLWGVAKGVPLQSRRAAYTHLAHGELRIGVSRPTPEEARAAFERRWSEEGMRFVLSLVLPVMELYSEEQVAGNGLKLARGLSSQPGAVALKDGARVFAFWARLNPTDGELPVLAATAEARWVKVVALENRRGLGDEQRSELMAALQRSKGWVRTADDLGASDKKTKAAEAEIAEAEEILVRIP
jgi:hypothetical protein